jgi:hypothetical protein
VAAIEPPGAAAMLRGMNGLGIFAVQNDPRDAAYNAPSIGPAPPFAQYNSLSHAETAAYHGLLQQRTQWFIWNRVATL